jgi:hypothetical protein
MDEQQHRKYRPPDGKVAIFSSRPLRLQSKLFAIKKEQSLMLATRWTSGAG